jgi:hypothetical protein
MPPVAGKIHANPWMNPITEFTVFEGKEYAPSTRRVYVSAAKKALKIAGKGPEDSGSYEELLALLRENLATKKIPKALKIAPFLSFLDSRIPKDPDDITDFAPIRTWVTDRVAEETRAARNASHFIRRDLAMLVGLCLAPGKGSPRHWPKSALVVKRQKAGGFEVKLWDRTVENQGFALTLLYWHTWRERLDRPEQSRIHRKAWAYSDLLFPNSKGEALTKYAMRNALSRLSVRGEGRVRLTPGMIRRAFLQV